MNREAKIGLFIVLIVALFAAVLFGRAVSRRRAGDVASPASAERDRTDAGAPARVETRESDPGSGPPPDARRDREDREDREDMGERIDIADRGETTYPSGSLAISSEGGTAESGSAARETREPAWRPPTTGEPVAERTSTILTAPVEHIVAEGDSLWTIAMVRYGRAPTPGQLAAIAAASGIEVESMLTIGQVLTIPAARARRAAVVRRTVAPVAPVAGPGQHVVAEGDSLWTIAMVRYGRAPTPAQLEAIAAASGIEVESVLTVGQVLTLPPLERRATRPERRALEY